MSLIIDLPASAEKALKSKARAEGLSAERYAQQVLERDLTPPSAPDSKDEAPFRSAADVVLRRMRVLPPTVFEDRPADGASQHDHYIYGTPKTEE